MAIPLVVFLAPTVAGLGFLTGLFGGTAGTIRGELTDATDPKYREREAALQNYTQHILGMGWPDELSDVLIIEATYAPGDDAQSVYLHMARETPVIINDMMIDPASLRNYSKVQAWLVEAAKASGATTDAISAVTGTSLFVDTVRASAQQVKDTANPKKSIWPWVAVGMVGLYLYKQ